LTVKKIPSVLIAIILITTPDTMNINPRYLITSDFDIGNRVNIIKTTPSEIAIMIDPHINLSEFLSHPFESGDFDLKSMVSSISDRSHSPQIIMKMYILNFIYSL